MIEVGSMLHSSYEIEKLLGIGGMGKTFLAKDLKLGSKLVVKSVRDDLKGSEEILKRFRREIRILKGLFHPNIIRIITCDTDVKEPWFAMEYCPDGNLEEWAKRNDGKDVLPMFLQACSAIDYFHRVNKRHRDIKPENILIGLDGLAKVADFGLAYEVDRPSTPLTESGRGLGTPAFMAPEQVHGAKDVGDQADVYSLAMTLFFILTGELPFTRANQPPVRYGIPEGIEDQLFTIISEALRQDPAKRTPTVSVFADSIRRLLPSKTNHHAVKKNLPNSLEELFNIQRKISNDETSVLRRIRNGEEIAASCHWAYRPGRDDYTDYRGPFHEMEALLKFGLITANVDSDQEDDAGEGWIVFRDVAIAEKGLAIMDLIDIHLKEMS